MIRAILIVEVLTVGLSAVFLTPVMIVQGVGGYWLGLRVYARAACWGALFLTAAEVLIREVAR